MNRTGCTDNRERFCIGKALNIFLAAVGRGRITICLPSSLISFGGIPFSCHRRTYLRTAFAGYRHDGDQRDLRRPQFRCGAIKDTATRREHSEQVVLPSGIFSFTIPKCSLQQSCTQRPAFQDTRADVFREARLLLIEVNSHQRKIVGALCCKLRRISSMV